MTKLDPTTDRTLKLSDLLPSEERPADGMGSQTPREFRFQIESLKRRIRQTISLSGKSELQFCEEKTGMWPTPPQCTEFAIHQEDWRIFWVLVEKLEIWSWGRYQRIRHDGWTWSLELADADRYVQSGGRNASPPGFQEFSNIINRLVDGRMRA
jgi:hypothetical protein